MPKLGFAMLNPAYRRYLIVIPAKAESKQRIGWR
jgi:uncharacterized protein YktA (UPF0223 family)